MKLNGKLLVIGMLVLAAVGVGVNIAIQQMFAGGAVEFWGRQGAGIIKQGPQVTAFRLGEAVPGSELGGDFLPVGERRLPILQQKDASTARGLLHMRNGLTTDSSFKWDQVQDKPPGPWHFALQFASDQAECTVLLTEDCLYTAPGAGWPVLPLEPKANGDSPLKAFMQEQFEEP